MSLLETFNRKTITFFLTKQLAVFSSANNGKKCKRSSKSLFKNLYLKILHLILQNIENGRLYFLLLDYLTHFFFFLHRVSNLT